MADASSSSFWEEGLLVVFRRMALLCWGSRDPPTSASARKGARQGSLKAKKAKPTKLNDLDLTMREVLGLFTYKAAHDRALILAQFYVIGRPYEMKFG
jgi:hypothetical protein